MRQEMLIYAFKNVYSPYGNLNSDIEYKLAHRHLGRELLKLVFSPFLYISFLTRFINSVFEIKHLKPRVLFF